MKKASTRKTLWPIGVWVLAIILLWPPWPARAAEEVASLWTVFTVEDGLRSANVLSILVAQDGTLWFGTDAGAGHYDGSWGWLTEADGLPASKVRAMAQTPDGALWFATNAGLARLAPDATCCTTWTAARGLPSDDILSLIVAPDSTRGDNRSIVWAGTTRGLALVDAQGVTVESAIPAVYVSVLALDNSGMLLAGVQGHGVWQRDRDGRWQALNDSGLPQGDIYALMPEADGTLWAGTASGLFVRRPPDGRWERFPLAGNSRDPAVFAVVRDPYGGLWAATDQGVYHYAATSVGDRPPARIRSQQGGLVNDHVRALALDRDNALWMGTIAGIARYGGIIWHVVSDPPLREQRINAILADRAGRVWVATETNGLALLDETGWQHFTAGVGLPDDRGVALFEDSAGRVWVATGTAVGRMTQVGSSWRFVPVEARDVIGLPVFAFAEDTRGVLWLGAERGAARWTEQEGLQRVIELQDARVNAICQARDGTLWFGTRADGLIRLISGQWQALTAGAGSIQINDVVVNGIVETDDGSLWVATYNDGLWRLRENMWERSDMNLASPKVLALHAQGNTLWVGTRQGLSGFDGLTWQSYRGDALPGPWVTALALEPAGALWIGTTAGLVHYRPETSRPWAQIEAVNLERPKDGHITLRDNRLHIIHLRGGDLATRAGNLLYLTQIEGLETTPRVHALSQVTAYSNVALPPGTYVLRVLARDVAFNYSRPAVLSITVPRMVALPGGYTVRASLFYPSLAVGALALTALGISSGFAMRARRLAAEKARRQREALARGFNPYISGEPVREPDMFFGRDELLQRIFNALHQNSIMIYGERRMGKTSLLYQLAELLRQADDPEWVFVPVYIDLEGTPEPRFFHQLMEAIAGALQSYLKASATPPLRLHSVAPEAYNDRYFVTDLRALLDRLKDTVAPRAPRVILLMDEMDVLSSYSTLTQQQLRRILISSLAANLGAVVAGVHISKDWDRLESPWYNLFNEIALEPFAPEEARALLTEPVRGIYEWEPAAIEAVIRRAGGRPHRLQQYALESVNQMLAAGRLRITLADVEAAHEIVERSYGP